MVGAEAWLSPCKNMVIRETTQVTVPNYEPARRTRQNVIALIVLAIVLLGGALLFHYLKQRTALIDCLSAGRRNCDQVMEPSDR